MRPLLCPSPLILDQNFPKSSAELEEVSVALAEIHSGLIDELFGLVLPEMFVLFIETFNWNRTVPTPLLRDIYRILESWLLKYEGNVIRPRLPSMAVGFHPLPCNCERNAQAFLWSEEMAKLLKEHDAVCEPDTYFIGVASHSAFAGSAREVYSPVPPDRHFPLVGPREVQLLEPYWYWDISCDLHQHKVSFADALNNVPLLGGAVEKPNRSSHYRVTFPKGTRPWILDYNDDPQEDSRIRQIVDLTGFPFEYIKYVLLYGKLPRLKGRFEGRLCC